MDASMIGFLAFFTTIVLFFAMLFLELNLVDRRAIKHGYGPKEQLRGAVCAHGKLVCVNAEAPTLGRSISFPYAFSLNARGADVTGTYKYRKQLGNYEGAIYLTFSNGAVKGRSLMGGLRTVDGVVGPNGVRVTRGNPKESFLSVLNGAYEYTMQHGKIYFEKTTRAGNISKHSDLTVRGGRVTGRVFHGPQKTWAVDVDITYQGVADEAVALAVILACDDILRSHHSD